VYVATLDSPSGMCGHGPFDDAEAMQAWFDGVSVFLDMEKTRAAGLMLVSPFKKATAEDTGGGSLYHQGMVSDELAVGFTVLMVCDDMSFGVGLFSDREAAAQWFLRERSGLGHYPGIVLPVVP
jgi:hypothetical protein